MNASEWVVRFAPLITPSGSVLDVACGNGRHTRLFLARGHEVVAVDIDLSKVSDLQTSACLKLIEADIERDPWPLSGARFDAVVVTNYLHRQLFDRFVEALAPEGILIYETYARGNERWGRPSNPDFLLRPGELLEVARGRLRVVAYEDVTVMEPRQAAVQRICAIAPPSQVGSRR
jgi:SAM-dependent methyltransferase